MSFSSANSINWGRLVPQIVYYVYSYATLLHNGDLAKDDEFNVVVPTEISETYLPHIMPRIWCADKEAYLCFQ